MSMQKQSNIKKASTLDHNMHLITKTENLTLKNNKN